MKSFHCSLTSVSICLTACLCANSAFGQQPTKIQTHPPMRPLPVPSPRPLTKGPALFVDAAKGSDQNNGSEKKPWQSLAHAVKQLKPGDTLYLRGGTYYGHVTITCSGTPKQPITIRAYPGELAIVDGGLREFWDTPATAWEPCPGGAPGEYRSTKAYPDLGGTVDATNVLGNFGDSMVPLHGYRFLRDLRADHMFFKPNIRTDDKEGVYCGPGLYYDVKSGRIHVRMVPTMLKGLHEDNYKGEGDPRKLALVVAGLKGGSPLAFKKTKNLIVQDLVARGSRAPTIDIVDGQHLIFDGLTVYGGSTCFRVVDTHGLRLLHTACRGLAAPWTFRGSLKYRAIESRLFSASGWEPTGKDNRYFEIAYSEFTDSVDGVFIGNVDSVKFNNNLVENISDDGIFLTATTGYDGETPGGFHVIYGNHLSRCLTTFAFGVGHGRQKALPGGARQTGGPVALIYRNVIDLRRPVMYHQPSGLDDQQEITSTGRLASDHGSPTWEPMAICHNTIIANDPAGYSYGALGLGDHMGGGAKREVQNNLVVQLVKLPGLTFPTMPVNLFTRNNLLWSFKAGPALKGDFLAKVRSLKLVQERTWTEGDLFADPKFVQFDSDWRKPVDLRLQKDSVAVDAGAKLPVEIDVNLPVLVDKGKPDLGALPFGAEPWRVGIRGRLNQFGSAMQDPPNLEYKPLNFAPIPPTPKQPGPAAIVQGYPAFDAPILEFALNKRHVETEVFDKSWLDPQDYARYKLVTVVASLVRAKTEPNHYSKDDLPHVKKFLEGGGTLLILRAGREVFNGPDAKGFLSQLIGTCPPAMDIKPEILDAKHPWLKHLKPAEKHTWLTQKPLEPWATSKGKVILGTPAGHATLYRVAVGKGQLIYFGWEIAASLPSKAEHSVEKEKSFEDQAQILFNVIEELFPAKTAPAAPAK